MKQFIVNKGIVIGISVAIVIGAIGIAYSFLGSQDQSMPEEESMGMSDKADVDVTIPSEEEEPPHVEIFVEERMGIEAEP